MKLLSTGNPKVLKGMAQGYNTYILHLAPANLSGYETCAKRTTGCTAACLNTAGRGGMFKKGEFTNVIQKARIRKTKMFFEDRIAFMALLVADVELGIKQISSLTNLNLNFRFYSFKIYFLDVVFKYKSLEDNLFFYF